MSDERVEAIARQVREERMRQEQQSQQRFAA